MNLLLAGKGGQGVVFLSDILANSFFAQGFDVKSRDSVGIAKRGGVVSSHLRWGSNIHSPILRNSSADLAILLDPSAVPYALTYLTKDSRVFLVSSKEDARILSLTRNLVLIDRPKDLPANTFALGIFFPVLELSRANVESVISSLPSAALNLAAFRQAADQAVYQE